MSLSRREVLTAGLAAAVGAGARRAEAACGATKAAATGDPIAPEMRLSCAAYSMRKYLPRGDKKGTMTMHDFFDQCAAWGLTATEPTTYYFSSEDKKYLHSLKAHAFKLGLDISGTAIGNNFVLPPGDERDEQVASTKQWIDHAVEFGAPCIRVFAGHGRQAWTREQGFGWVTDCLKTCCDYAGERGVFLAIENHGYLTEKGEDVVRIVETVRHEWLGINLDTGNFHGDAYAEIAIAAPHAITSQVKPYVRDQNGKVAGPADFGRIVEVLRKANYRGYLALEHEGNEEPLTDIPRLLAELRKYIGC
jgi:sugar phosphate isomerase/epimerase